MHARFKRLRWCLWSFGSNSKFSPNAICPNFQHYLTSGTGYSIELYRSVPSSIISLMPFFLGVRYNHILDLRNGRSCYFDTPLFVPFSLCMLSDDWFSTPGPQSLSLQFETLDIYDTILLALALFDSIRCTVLSYLLNYWFYVILY